MKIAVISNKRKNKFMEKSNYIVENLKTNKEICLEKLDVISDIKKLDDPYDVYMIITNNINEVLFCKRKIKQSRKVLILTENTNVKFIMCCIEFTKNLLYLNVDFGIILEKLNSIHIKNYREFGNK